MPDNRRYPGLLPRKWEEQFEELWPALGRGFQQWWQRDVPALGRGIAGMIPSRARPLPTWLGSPETMPQGYRWAGGEIPVKPSFTPWRPEFLTEEIFPRESEAQRARQAAFGLLEPEKLDLYSQIMKAAGALRRTPEEIEANLREQLLESGVLTDENANLEQILRVMPYQGLAAYYSQLRTEYGRLPIERREPTDIEREQLWQTQGWTKIPLTGEGGGYQWEAPLQKPSSGMMAEQQRSNFLVKQAEQIANMAKGGTAEERLGALREAESFLHDAGYESEIVGQTILSLSHQERLLSEQVKAEQGETYRAEYPKWWEKYVAFQTTPPEVWWEGQRVSMPSPAEGGFQPTAGGFLGWLEGQPQFKEAKRAKETEFYTEYPRLYPEYLKAPMQERRGFLPWIEKTPWAKAYQNLQEPRYGAVRTPKWATARQRM